MTMTLIETKTLGSTQSSIVFTSIPQTFTDIVFLISARSTRAGAVEDGIGFQINSSTSGYTYRTLIGTGSSIINLNTSFEQTWAGVMPGAGSTNDTFGNATIYVPNYAGSTAKSYSSDSVTENNTTAANQAIHAGLQSSTAAITSVTIFAQNGNLLTGTTVSLYGILKGSSNGVVVS